MPSKKLTALVIGSTGITGAPLVQELCNSSRYRQVVSFSRKKLDFHHDKLVSHIVDFDEIEQWQQLLKGDDLFSALGTTRKQAGSTAAQYRVDHDYQVATISAAANNGVKRLFLVSSPNASSRSPFFYARMKGEVEDAARQQPFESQIFIQPSVIHGDRPDNRYGEALATGFLRGLKTATDMLPFRHIKKATNRVMPITGEALAKGIVILAEQAQPTGVSIYRYDEIPR